MRIHSSIYDLMKYYLQNRENTQELFCKIFMDKNVVKSLVDMLIKILFSLSCKL